MQLNFRFLFFALLCQHVGAFAQSDYIKWGKPNPWVDSVYATMTEDERIAQLIMIAAFSNRDSAHIRDVECHVRELKVGGIIFFKGSPHKQAALTNQYQALAKVPLIIGIDGEWGLSMRLDSTPVFPRQMLIGAARDEQLMYDMGKVIGRQCKRIGIHWNFAPDIDVNNNPNNPVINDRSFGEHRQWVSRLGMQYARGMQDENIVASAKHFPGHGDTETDSHYGLPVIKGDRKRLDSLELYPFKELIAANVMSVMVAHLNVPAIDTTKTPTSISNPVITGLLRNEMGFEGLVITDALNMKGVADFYGPGEVAAKAFAAGNDVLLFVEDVPMAIMRIKEYLAKGEITWEQIEKSCKKILATKFWLGLNQYKPINLENLTTDLNCCETYLMTKKVIKQGIIVARDDDKIIPIQNPELYQIAVVSLGSSGFTPFQEMCTNYIKADYYSIDKAEMPQYFDSLFMVLNSYNLIILSLQNTSRFVSKKLGLTTAQIDFCNRLLAGGKKVILVNHGNPYILRQFNGIRNAIIAYEDLEEYNQLSAQVLFGAVKAVGVLPVTVNENFAMGSGEKTNTLERLEYVYPEEIGIDHTPLNIIDTIATQAINSGATPGCQVLVSKDGKVIYQKSFGYHTYDKIQMVKNYHAYDLASLTKILATTLAVMKLHDEKKLKIEAHLGDYLPELKGSNKEHLTLHDVLLHQAGLVPYVPFYKKTLVNGNLNPILYANQQDSNYSTPVAYDLYLHNDYEAVLWQQIIDTEVKQHPEYIYSDIGFILMRKIVERISGQSFETYLGEQVYKPLNLSVLQFNPLNNLNRDWIVPTEWDSSFRKQLLNGTVHDPTAAMLGGISGHAGLFGNANDVAVIMQMLLNGGEYGGKRILKESTIKDFTKKHGKASRRGLGFDKPETDTKKASPTSRMASPLAFGHTGFTGTCAWADPKYGLVYVFLSNRVHPSAENKKLVDMNIRTRIMDVIYETLRKSGK
jgi:beta-glucosidase-like glycosyl hydrolase/CubicO group peptidase (beta-lactamase class C family)